MSHSSAGSTLRKSPLGAIFFILASVVVLAIALLSRFHGFKIYDDAYMFVRYADHLIAGHGMVWNVGDGPVYGATSLAYVIAVIPFRLAFPDNPAATLFTSSFFWGLVFVGLMFRLGLKTMNPTNGFKPFVAGFVFLTLISAAVTMRAHFASGMETTFVMSYLGVCLILWERLRMGHGNAWLAGIIGGCAWWVRPDLLIFVVGIPALMIVFSTVGQDRANWLRVTLGTLAFTGIALLGAKMLTGAWLPLSFFAKNTGLYGSEFAATYRWLPLAEAARFVARTWPALLLLGMGVFLKWPRLLTAYSGLDKAILAAMLVYTAYFTFFVLQVMGFGQRFYFPLLPFLLYLGTRELLELPENLRLGPGIKFKCIPYQYERVGMVVLGAVLIYYGVDYGRSMKQSQLDRRLAVFSASATYRAELTDYWAKLDALAGLPNELSIATSEVGMPAALYPDRKIYDLAALNEPKLLAAGLSAESILAHCPADLIYLPHENYKQINASLAASTEFSKLYETVSAKDLGALMGVAIRKDSPYAEDLRRIFVRE